MKKRNYPILLLLTTIFLLTLSCRTQLPEKFILKGIHPSVKHLQYWTYNGKEILLLGGSDEDNLFQMPNLIKQLDLLASVGGNYVRNTMSSRDSGNVWPFLKNEEGLYDLKQYNPEYWSRFDTFLQETKKRNIIVQIEIWATFDFYRNQWLENPFNPKNNINMGFNWSDGNWSKLDTVVPSHPIYTANNFFRSIPSQMALHAPLYYQQKFVDKLMDIALDYDHVLYCIDNETSVNSDWAKFWVDYIKKIAKLNDKKIYCTEMWDPHELDHAFHYETFDNPQIFDFVDISQNNHLEAQNHWDNGLKQFERLKKLGYLRPVNNVKVYGNDGGKHKTTRNAIESYIQNVFMGCASTRFHRPTSGQGLNNTAQNIIKSMRELTNSMNWFEAQPNNTLFRDREPNETYCRTIPGKSYAIYFTNGGEVILKLDPHDKTFEISWINPLTNQWSEKKSLSINNNTAKLKAPDSGHWICLIQ